MPKKTIKNRHNRKGKKPKLPSKTDWLKDKPLNRDNLFIRVLNQTSPIRKK